MTGVWAPVKNLICACQKSLSFCQKKWHFLRPFSDCFIPRSRSTVSGSNSFLSDAHEHTSAPYGDAKNPPAAVNHPEGHSSSKDDLFQTTLDDCLNQLVTMNAQMKTFTDNTLHSLEQSNRHHQDTLAFLKEVLALLKDDRERADRERQEVLALLKEDRQQADKKFSQLLQIFIDQTKPANGK